MPSVNNEHRWIDFKCPVCEGNNFSSSRYDLLDGGGILDAMKGRVGKSLKVEAKTCRDCGYIIFKKSL